MKHKKFSIPNIKPLCRLVLALALAEAAVGAVRSKEPIQVPPLTEVYALVTNHLSVAPPEAINRAAVEGLVEKLYPAVQLIPELSGNNPAEVSKTNASTRLFEGRYAWLHLAAIEAGATAGAEAALASLCASNQVKGVVLDLRFCKGWNYWEAARLAGLFLPDATPLFAVGGKTLQAEPGKFGKLASAPLVALVNRETAGAAEALAAALRERRGSLLIGRETAGKAFVQKVCKLSTGQRLRVATDKVRLARRPGSPLGVVQPDLEVDLSLADQAAYLADPFAVANAALRPRESDLVQMHRAMRGEAEPGATNPPPREVETVRVVRDPMLARALDLLKAMEVLTRTDRPPAPEASQEAGPKSVEKSD